MPERIKEPHYFDPELGAPRMKPFAQLENYLTLFEEADHAKCVGEASVLYLYSQRAARAIYDFNPSSKIIIMLRNPVDMLYSLYYQEIRGGNEVLSTFEEALAAESDRKVGKLIPARSTAKKLFYRDIGRYGEQVQRYFDIFPREAIYVIIFDDFVSDTAKVYRDTLAFLGVSTDFKVDLTAKNVNKIVRYPLLNRIVVRPPGWYKMLLELTRLTIPFSIRKRLNQAIARYNIYEARRPPLSVETRRQLSEELRPDIEKLSSILHRDLTYWCS